jgi:hypothetical protein
MAFDLSSYLSQFGGGRFGGGNPWGDFEKRSGLDLQSLFGQQQGYIQGLGSPETGTMRGAMGALQGFRAGGMDPFIQQLLGFKPELAGDVRGTMAGIMQDPWGGTAGSTLEQMLTTGAPTDVSGIGEAAKMQGARAFEQMTGAARERAAAGGGLSGSGFAAKQARMGGDIADMIQSRMLEAGVGAQEAAAGRRMGALGQHLAGQGLAAQTAQGLGGLETALSGQQLEALLGGGGLAGQQAGMGLQALLGAGGLASDIDRLGFAGQQAQAGAGQSFLSMLPGFAQSGAFQGGPMSPHMLAQYIGAVGGAENLNLQGRMSMMNPYMRNPTRASAPAAQAGGGGGRDKGVERKGARKIEAPVLFRTPIKQDIQSGRQYYTDSRGGRVWYDDYIKSLQGRGGGAQAGGGTIPSGKKFGPEFQMPTFTPPGQPMPKHPAAAAQEQYQDWAKLWEQYSKQFTAGSTAGGYTGA